MMRQGCSPTRADGGFDGFFEDLLGVRGHHECQHPAEGDRAALLAKLRDALVEIVRGGVREGRRS